MQKWLLLQHMYRCIYSNRIKCISRFYRQSKNLAINHEQYISSESRSNRSHVIAAHWPGVIDIDIEGEAPMRVGVITGLVNRSPTQKLFTPLDYYFFHSS